MRYLRLALLPLLLIACTDTQPVAPDIEMNAPSFKVTRDAWVEVTDLTGLVVYVECRGEDLEWSGTIDGYYRSETTPSGNEVVHWKLDYATETPLTIRGLTSGDDWTLVGAEDTGGSLTKPKGTTYVEHWQARERYVNQDGEKLHDRIDYRIMIDDGNVKLQRYREIYTCPGKP
ncbi:MAG: hypothetical protein OEO20_17110 [Gemmatimonadota bacterium]|nr:hypothetical protein [Gemmatimonadota bacterium]MDH3368900.1 hypothetical protein [Gemmatimonadota bacterium]MDH3480018.1 hypothetical protein [Gemmatimonadota bacterium]MDH5549756.1 hypothetical protein [Gemmatimonadota bacterium]